MKVIYLAGAYRAATIREIVENINKAESWALQLWKAGAAVISPHMNTRLFDGALPDEIWLQGDVEIMKRCDCMAVMPGWENSRGTREELIQARLIGNKKLPVFFLGSMDIQCGNDALLAFIRGEATP